MNDVAVKRGDVWWVSFDPSLGGEIHKTRPAIVVSNDIANKYLNRVQVVPLTSNTDKLYPSEAYIMLEGHRSKAKADQLTTVSKQRLQNKVGSISPAEFTLVETAIRQQLDL